MTKKVLIVGMLDSIHLARWLTQFHGTSNTFLLYPSRSFKSIHPKLNRLIEDSPNFQLVYSQTPRSLAGYLDFALSHIFKMTSRQDFRSIYLRRIIRSFNPDYVHAIEIQSAGYLCDNVIDGKSKSFKFILTNWGSDIFYFRHFPDHLIRIKSVLTKADYYSAECDRDYRLASNLGFKGVQLPCIPNAGGFKTFEFSDNQVATSKRLNIIVKAYGGTFGRGALAIEVLSEILIKFPKVTVFFYSVTSELIDSVVKLSKKFPERIRFSTQSNPMGHEALREVFAKSRVYVGCSVSDGISTSFLESLTTGAYPIQTNTSCAGEWVKKGVIASLIPLEKTALANELQKALRDDQLVDLAQHINSEISRQFLNFETIKDIAVKFYTD